MWRIGPIGAVGIVAAALLTSWFGDSDAPAPEPAVPRARPAPPPPQPPVVVAPSPSPAEFRFAPTQIEAIRRLPHHTTRFGFVVPGGPYQIEAVRAARRGRCAEALSVVFRAIDRSTDFAPLYGIAWDCFDRHQQAILAGSEDTFTAFGHLQHHFQGNSTAPATPEVPEWMRAPLGGIEYRLQAYMGNSQPSALLRDVMVDLRGRPTIADTLVQDVQLLLDAAVALANDDPTAPGRVTLWAHYVYWSTLALDNPEISQLIRDHRPGDIPNLERQYDEATTASAGESLPEPVQLAMQLGVSP